MPWPARTGPSVLLLTSGSLLTVAGTLMYCVPRMQTPLFAVGSLALAFTAAVAASILAQR
ncbi:hypothetical protein ACFVDH_15395 [Streptomyces sp. NPDC057674]|uniref:hypothetical protein n=1 Tax=Streptomyces sp. NPDC057674 TaxID=3346203 RepID=UPI0036C31FB0